MGRPKKIKELVVTAPAPVAPASLIKLDLGCGGKKISPDFIGVDSIQFPGVDMAVDLVEETIKSDFVLKNPQYKKWPWEDNSVDEVHCSHFIEHLTGRQRIHFLNELYRILKPGAKATIIAPHWSSRRAYGDLTHQWPPVSEFNFYYLDRHWRLGDTPGWPTPNAPHDDVKYNPNGLSCHFAVTWGYALPNEIKVRNQEYQNEAMNHWKDVCEDIYATFVKVVD